MRTAYCPEALKETTKALRIVVLPIPNHEVCPRHRGGISDSRIYFRKENAGFCVAYLQAPQSVRRRDAECQRGRHSPVCSSGGLCLAETPAEQLVGHAHGESDASILATDQCMSCCVNMNVLHRQHKIPPLKLYPVGVKFSKPRSMLTLHLCQGLTSGLCYQVHRVSVHNHVSAKETLQFKFTVTYVIRCHSEFLSISCSLTN